MKFLSLFLALILATPALSLWHLEMIHKSHNWQIDSGLSATPCTKLKDPNSPILYLSFTGLTYTIQMQHPRQRSYQACYPGGSYCDFESEREDGIGEEVEGDKDVKIVKKAVLMLYKDETCGAGGGEVVWEGEGGKVVFGVDLDGGFDVTGVFGPGTDARREELRAGSYRVAMVEEDEC